MDVIHSQILFIFGVASKCNYMTKQVERSAFSAFRLKKETVKFLQDMKEAYEISYGKEFSNDTFIKQLASAIEVGDGATWEIYCKMQENKKALEELAAEGRKQRETQD